MKNKKKTEKLVKCVVNKKYLKANDILNSIIREKIDERVSDVLASQKSE